MSYTLNYGDTEIEVEIPSDIDISDWMQKIKLLDADYKRLKNAENTRKALNRDYYIKNKERLKEKSKENYKNKKNK